MITPGVLLAVIARGGHRDTLRAALDEAVVLVQGDGTMLVGREAVLAALTASDGGATREVLSVEPDGVRVALRVAGVPGALRFRLTGALRGDALVEVRVTL